MNSPVKKASILALSLFFAGFAPAIADDSDVDWDIVVDGDVQAECHGLYNAMAIAAKTEGTAKDVVRFTALSELAEKKALEFYDQAGLDLATAKKNIEMQRTYRAKKYEEVYAGEGGLAQAEEDAKAGCSKK